MPDLTKVAVITGASAGFGAATARALAAAGFSVVLGARRFDRIERLADELGGRALPLDVTSTPSVAEFAAQIPAVHLLVNNAGLSLGLDPIERANEVDWQTMFETNVMGVLRLTRALLPKLEASGDGHVIDIGSTSGFETYPGGAGYTASKHALRAFTKTLRLELIGRPIRVTDISPGLAETEFSQVRFGGDTEKAKAPYRGMTPLSAEDIADCVVWAATRPAHVNIDEIVIRPLDQATATLVHRRV